MDIYSKGDSVSSILDESHLYVAIRYVENNPVRAKIVEKPYKYRWSSARNHVYRRNDSILTPCYLEKEIRSGVNIDLLCGRDRRESFATANPPEAEM